MNKYLNPKKYINKLNEFWVQFNLKFNKNYIRDVKCLGKTVSFHLDSWKEYTLRLQNSYTGEPSTIKWIKEIVCPEDVVFDIGANVGAYSLLIGKIIKENGGGGSVLAFEPEASNFYKLNKNIQINDLSDVISSYCLAFGSSFEVQSFYLQSLEVGSACHSLGSAVSEGKTFVPMHRQGVIAFDLDSFIKQKNVPFPNHIKIDVDGLEKSIIESGKGMLKDTRLKSVVIEINDCLSKGSIENLLLSYGFKQLCQDVWEGLDSDIIRNILYVR